MCFVWYRVAPGVLARLLPQERGETEPRALSSLAQRLFYPRGTIVCVLEMLFADNESGTGKQHCCSIIPLF